MIATRTLSRVTTAVLAAAFVFSLAEASNAQDQGRYANRYSKRDVSGIIQKMETSSDEFRRDFDRAMDSSDLNGTAQETRYNNLVRDFENAVDRLRREFDRNDTWWNSRNEVQNMIRNASPVNTMMNNISFRRNIERQWNRLRNDVNTVADTYDLPGLNGGGWNGGGGGGWPGGGQTSTPPDWARGTFYSYNPPVTLTIERNGTVTSLIDGRTYTGRFYQGSIYSDGQTTSLTRTQTGFRTYNTTTGQTYEFSRSTGGGGGWPDGGQTSTPPDWARGTFYSYNPPVTLTIERNGRVTSLLDGRTYTGRFYQGSIYSDGQTTTLTRTQTGFRTYNTTTGQRYEFSRGTGGGGGGGGWEGPTSTPPDWMRGTFYSEYSNIRMTVERNGRVTSVVNGQTYYGRYHNGVIYSDRGAATVTRIDGGFRTYDGNAGQTLVFRRQ